jgi:transposase
MTEMKTDAKAELAKSIQLLQTLRDEAQVKIHLAGMEAKNQWKILAPRIEDALKKAAVDAAEASRAVVDDTVRALKEFSASLHKK